MKEKARIRMVAKFFAVIQLLVLTVSFNAVAGGYDSGRPASQETRAAVQDEETTATDESPVMEDGGSAVPDYSALSHGSALERMIVTATRRNSYVQELPFSVNVQSEDDIQRLNTANIEELSNNVAGLSIQNLGPGQSVVNIRGVSSGQIVRDQPGVKEQVGVYLDETPISLSLFTPDLDLFDLDRVETLRGPQGTLFGSGSIGGTVRYITNQPELNVTETKTELDLNIIDGGSAGGHLKTAFNVPLGEVAALRTVLYGTRYGGFIDALREPEGVDRNVNDGDRLGGRVALLLKPTENLSITPRVVYQKIDMEGFNRDEAFNLFANPHTTTRPPVQLGERQQKLLLDEAFEDETLILDTVAEWRLENLFSVTYMFSYTNRDILVSRDASALAGSVSVNPLGLPDEAVLLPSNLRDTTDLKQITHELHLSSSDESALQWLAGIFYSNTDRDYSQRLPTPGYDSFVDAKLGAGTSDGARNGFPDTDSPYVSDLTYDLRQIALFGESTLTALDRLGLTAGLRWYDWEENRTFRSGGIFSNSDNQSDSTESNGFTPRFMINYAVTGQIAVNAQASRGFRLGGVNDPLNRDLCEGSDIETFGGFQKYDDETLWNYEFGFKSLFENVMLNASVFYTDIKNLQVTLDAGSCSSRISFNVPEAHTAGTEFELETYLTESLQVSFAGSYVTAEFDSTVRDDEGEIIGGVEKGNRLAAVPEWQFSAAATYTFPGVLMADEGYFTAAWQYVGERITQPGDQVEGAGSFIHDLQFAGIPKDQVTTLDLRLDPYHLINLSTGLVYDRLELMLYVKNLTDKNVKLSFDRERGGRARLAYRVGQPRTFGLTARMYF